MARNSVGSSNQSHFSKVPSVHIQRSVFDRTSQHKTTFDSGLLIPFFVDEILPGDTMRLTSQLLARLATPIFPYMDNVYLDTHFFFVPNRLVWDNWEKFNGAQDNPGDSTDFLVPQLDATTHSAGFGEETIHDYLGLPTKVTSIVQADMPIALVHRAYNLIWNAWYRDQNLQDSVDVPTDDGPDTTAYTLLRRGRRKDYFTSALPWPQKGPSVLLPLGGTAPVVGIGKGDTTWVGSSTVYESDGTQSTFADSQQIDGGANGTRFWVERQTVGGVSYPNIRAVLSEATAATINELRESFQLQRLFERDARGGTRYVELLLSHFGVVSPDFRLQRPEYLGGGSTPINVNPIAQTSETTTDSPQGNLSAFATATGRNGFNHSFVEHGFVLGLLSVRADTSYQQGMDRMWSRRTRYDYYWPTLAHLGEQTVLNKEIYMQSSTATNNSVFGYQERYAEYRYKPSRVSAKFRSNSVAPLDSWHLALDFDTLPTLAGIVEEHPPIDRIIAVPAEPQFICDTYTRIKHARPMPTYSIPGMIDQF